MGIPKGSCNIVYGPVYWFRQKFIEPAQGESFPWYHRRFNRVPGIEECYTEDVVCREEANHQFKRDWLVEEEIVYLLRERMNDCFFYEKGTGVAHMQVSPQPLVDVSEGSTHVCKPLYDAYEKAAENYYIKYGEVSRYYVINLNVVIMMVYTSSPPGDVKHKFIVLFSI